MGYDFLPIKEIISRMSVGEEDAIINGLSHKGALIRINAVMFAVKYKCKKNNVIELIKELLTDNTEVDGYSVSQFSIAALDVLGITKYTGNDENVVELIDDEFLF